MPKRHIHPSDVKAMMMKKSTSYVTDIVFPPNNDDRRGTTPNIITTNSHCNPVALDNTKAGKSIQRIIRMKRKNNETDLYHLLEETAHESDERLSAVCVFLTTNRVNNKNIVAETI